MPKFLLVVLIVGSNHGPYCSDGFHMTLAAGNLFEIGKIARVA